MTKNIEQRTEAAVSKYEGAAGKAEQFAETDSTVSTAAGPRKSFPKLSREIEGYALESLRLGVANRQGDYSVGVTYDNPNWTYTYNGQQWGLSANFDLSLLPYETTEVDPNDDDNLSVYGNASKGYVNQAQGEAVGGSIYPEAGVLANGMTVPEGTTHLRVLINGRPALVAMSPVESGVVSGLGDASATIGGRLVSFSSRTEFPSVNDMLNSSNTFVGFKYSTGITTWKKISDTNGDISDFRALNGVHVEDFGAKGGDPSYDDYFGIIAAVNAIQAIGGGALVFTQPDYYVNQYRIDGGVDANGVTNFKFENIPVKIKGNGTFLHMIGGWTRRQNNGSNSYDNCVGFEFRRCPSVTTEDLTMDGGCETITKVATVEGVSYGILYAGCEEIIEKNLIIQHYTTDGISYARHLAEVEDPYDQVISKNVTSTNVTCRGNGRQGASIVGLRNGVFINCKYYNSGTTDYGGHAPQAGVDVEPSASPIAAITTDEFTGNLTYHSCYFGGGVGSTFIASGRDSLYIRGHITHYDCTYNATGSENPNLVANVENFKSYNPTLINCEIAPGYGSAFSAKNSFYGGKSTITENGPRMYTAGALIELNMFEVEYDFSPPLQQSGQYAIHSGSGKIERCKTFITKEASPDPTIRHSAVSLSGDGLELEANEWDTDLVEAGLYSILSAGNVKVKGDKYKTPAKISPGTSAYSHELYSRGAESAYEIQGNSGYKIFFGNPVNGASYTRGDTAVISASAGGYGFNKCTTTGVQGVDAVFKLCGAIEV
ncbi:hypothetical protein [Vibrio sp. JZG120]